MGIMDRFSEMFKTDDYSENDYDNYENEGDEVDEAPVAATTAPSRSSSGISSASALEMKVCKPTKFEEVTEIAEHLLARRTVVLNLEDANKETVIRIIDFLFGVTFAIEGHLKRVASSTYVITPKNVEVTGDQKEREEAKPRELF